MTFGSDVQCPIYWNELRVPTTCKEATLPADAYRPPSGVVDAACRQDLAFDPIRTMIRCHSIHWEPTFLSEPSALASATCLRNEVLGSGFDLHEVCRYSIPKNQRSIVRSILKNHTQPSTAKKVQILPFAEILESYYPPRVEPHRDGYESITQAGLHRPKDFDAHDTVSLMARQPRQAPQPSSESDSDLATHLPTSPDSISDSDEWQSVQVFDLRSNLASGRIRTHPPAAFFIETRRLLGYGHHDVANIYDIRPMPHDLQAASVQPLLLLANDDIRFGDNRRAILVDVEIHGSTPNAVVEVDRYTILLPTPIHRSLLLRIAGVAAYCKLRQDRCLLWHKGNLISHQRRANLDLSHGDYVRIAVPPFVQPEIPTYFAIRACQQGMNHGQIVHRFHVNPDPDDLYTEVEAEQEIADENAMLQVSTITDMPVFDCKIQQHFGTQNEPPSFESASPAHFQNHQRAGHEQPTPAWIHDLHSAFVQQAEVECEEEGPIAFLDTWFLSGSHEQVHEDRRVLRLDQHAQFWTHDLVNLWRDKIQMQRHVHYAFVRPEPPKHDTSWTIGHLLVFQDVQFPFVPVLVTIQMLTAGHTRLNYAAAVLHSPTTALQVRDLCRLGRICVDRRCDLQVDQRNFGPTDSAPVYPGIGLIFNVHPPVRVQHVGDEHVIISQWFVTSTSPAQNMPEAVPNFADQTEFTRELFGHWDVHARTGPAHIERLLQVRTWCLHSDRLRVNDEVRIATLGDDFHMWEDQLRRAWTDLLDPHTEVAFAIAHDHEPGQLHIILHQLLQPQERATLTTTYDDGVMQNQPFTTAVILLTPVLKLQLLTALNRQQDCPPLNSHTFCSAWQGGSAITNDEAYHCCQGMTFTLIIQRLSLADWYDDDAPTVNAASSTSLLQRSSFRRTAQQPQTRRQTTGLVAHTQWPESTKLKLEELIEPPMTVNVDFSTVTHLDDEILNMRHHFQQCWPPDLSVPDATTIAMQELIPLDNHVPQAFHFYTDGSKLSPDFVGAAVVHLIESNAGWHYGGCLFRKVETGKTSVAGENGALIWALLWALHCSNDHWRQYGNTNIAFSFNFDATSSGFLAAGYWRTTHAHNARTIMRSLAQVLQTRHGFNSLAWHYIKAHAGHPWNEAADALAKWVVNHFEQAQSSALWELWLDAPQKMTALQWLWYKELTDANDPRVPPLVNGQLRCIIPRIMTPSNDGQNVPHVPSTPALKPYAIKLKIATANVMTLASQKKSAPTISRQHILMKQFHDASCTLVGVQETRHRHLAALNNEFYHIIGHPATPDGHDGIQFWVSKQLPYDDDGNTILKQDIKVIASDVDFLIVSLKLHTWRMILVTCRAPHSGKTKAEAYLFWQNITEILQKKARGAPVFFCGDANAHLGEHVTPAVGPHQPAIENQAGQVFHEWLLLHELFVPATFQCHHRGEASTFTTPDGERETRIDYVALPCDVAFDMIESAVENDIDLSVHRHDHRAVSCNLAWQIPRPQSHRSSRRKHGPDVCDLASKLQDPQCMNQLHYIVTAPPWTLDPHVSAEWLAASAASAATHIARPKGQWRRKSHISEHTWKLVDTKKALFKQLKSLKRAQRATVIKTCFQAWQATTCPNASNLEYLRKILKDLPAWFRLHDIATAQTANSLRLVAQDVHNAIQQEDVKYYASIAEKTATTFQVEGLTGIWAHLKAILPKHRSKRCHMPRDIDAELLDHFQELEAGTTVQAAALALDCMARNNEERAREPKCLHLSLTELPTLVEVDMLCLKQKPRKASGPDGIPSDLCRHGAVAIAPQLHSVICKALLHGAEPVSYKGGRLCAIHKGKGSLDDASAYHGILLANSFAKVTHAWARMRLLPTLHSRRTIGQIGGLPSQQTVTAIQMIRLHGAIGQAQRVSTATLFIDLRSAFHHMIRELVFSTHNTLQRPTLATFLDESDFDLDRLERDLNHICANQPDDIPPGLRRFLHDLHCHTWFQLGSENHQDASCTHTKRGTRPGSPMADIGFNLMMSDILQEITRLLNESEHFHDGAKALGTYVPPVAWVDDVAIALAAAQPSDLIPLVQYALEALHKTFRNRGLTLNLDPGKTEVVVCFRGKGAVQCRKDLFLQKSTPAITVATDTHLLTVRVVSSYRHLGVRFSMNMDLDSEISARMGAARQAFEQMRQSIFMNKALPVKARLQLFNSLVLSRLLYGCAIWSEISSTSFRKLEALTTDCYRRICGVGFWSSERVNDADFLRDHELAPFRIFLARHRLGFLRHLAQHAITAHKSMLLSERANHKGWLYEVEQDLQWLATMRDLPFDIPHDRESWVNVWTQLRNIPQWKAWIHRAVCKHTAQENLAYNVHFYHTSIIDEMTHFGMKLLDMDQDEVQSSGFFPCPHRTAVFTTCQQLGVHAFRQHGIRAQESMYVQSEICPGCLKTFHTTFRVMQHLRYRGNKCWERVHGAKEPAEPGQVRLPPHLAGIHRLPAIRVHHGPLRPTAHHRERLRVRRQIEELEIEGRSDFAWWDPLTDEPLTSSCCRLFEECLDQWIESDEPNVAEFHNRFFQLFFNLHIPEFQTARIFIHWIESDFYSYIEKYAHLDAFQHLEEAHMTFLTDIHIWNVRNTMKRLRARWEVLEQGEEKTQRSLPDRDRAPRAARTHPVVSTYNGLVNKENHWRAWRMTERPQRARPKAHGPFFIVHLYAGRRRQDDFHEQVTRLISQSSSPWSNEVYVISIDTAISDRMNVHDPKLWGFLLSAAQQGRILGLLLGPPCETWPSARHAELLDVAGQPIRGPRPLRSADCPWGLPKLSLAELKQVAIGNCLLLRGIWLCVPVALCGGAVILEHPAPPLQPDRAAIWRTGVVNLLLRDGWLFRRHTFRQGHHGACGSKPTSLLYANCNISDVLTEFAQPMHRDRIESLIGHDEHGRFRTSKAKEYPPNFCMCLAVAFWRRIESRQFVGDGGDLDSFAEELVRASSCVDHTRCMRPDYQPMS